MSQTTLTRIQEDTAPAVSVGFDTLKGFEAMQRMANLFSASSIVPEVYRSKGEKDYTSRGNCVIALDMALRMGANPLMVMQNLYVVHGRPAWSAQFLIATLNQSGKFSALRYEFQGEEGQDEWGCRAVATELATKERLVGPRITIGLAKKEGWYSKKDKFGKETSKWQSMPELMLRYRAAAWFVRAYAPEIAMGLQTVEEARDAVITVEPVHSGETMTLDDVRPTPGTETPAWEEPAAPEPPQAAPASESPRAESERNKASGKRAAPVSGKKEAAPAENEPSAAPQPAPEPKAAATERQYPCPRKDGALVEDEDCFHCPERDGCPER
ncbi:hypothetical protein [Desulfovibrio sp. SGI.169]|uniref:hypothetical protein n=1 Tax=Desulfovibrio sp. SGI.169 TaxID=3420561 RepID=UPI003D01587E